MRVRLPEGQSWDGLARWTPAEIRDDGLLPDGFKPLPHVKQATGGQVFPERQIEVIAGRSSATCGASTSSSTCPTPDAGVPAADLPDHAHRARRRIARPAADHPQLLRDHERPHHAGADGGPATSADAFPAGGVQPDRGPQGRRAEPRRRLPRLPLELPHQRRLPPDPGRAPAGRALPPRHHQPARRCSTSRSTARSVRCARSRTSPSSSSAPPISTATT